VEDTIPPGWSARPGAAEPATPDTTASGGGAEEDPGAGARPDTAAAPVPDPVAPVPGHVGPVPDPAAPVPDPAAGPQDAVPAAYAKSAATEPEPADAVPHSAGGPGPAAGAGVHEAPTESAALARTPADGGPGPRPGDRAQIQPSAGARTQEGAPANRPPPPGSPARLLPSDPTALGGYRLLGRLGAGGMGVVYLGRTDTGELAAVKVTQAEHADRPDFRPRFRREVAAARRVTSPWAAAVLGADPDAPEPWLATAFVPGPSLGEAVGAHGPLPERSVRKLGEAVARALDAVHAAGLVHRDVKPGNVLLALDGPRLIDFGIARAVDDEGLTSSDVVVGTPGFLAPEQAEARGADIGPASDVFALGCLLAYTATGRPPFGRGAVDALLYRTVHDEPDLDGIGGGLAAVLTACLAKDAGARPTAASVADALAGGTPPARSVPPAAAPGAGAFAEGRPGTPDGVPGPAVPPTADPVAVAELPTETAQDAAGRTPAAETPGEVPDRVPPVPGDSGAAPAAAAPAPEASEGSAAPGTSVSEASGPEYLDNWSRAADGSPLPAGDTGPAPGAEAAGPPAGGGTPLPDDGSPLPADDWLPPAVVRTIAERSAHLLALPDIESTRAEPGPAPKPARPGRRGFLFAASGGAVFAAGIGLGLWATLRNQDGEGGDRTGPTGPAGPPADRTAAIGVQADLTGPQRGWGIEQERGARLAVEQYNAREDKPFPLTLAVADDAGDRERAGRAAERLIKDKRVAAVLGSTGDYTTEAVLKVYDEAMLPLLSVSAGLNLLTAYTNRTFLRGSSPHLMSAAQIAFHVQGKTRSVRPGLLQDRTDDSYSWQYSGMLALRLGTNYRHRIHPRVVPASVTDYAPVIEEMLRAGIDSYIHCGPAGNAAKAARALAAAGFTGPRIATQQVLVPEFLQQAGEAAEGWLIAAPVADPERTPAARSFVAAYRSRYGRAPGHYAGEAYDAASMMIEAMAAGAGGRPPERRELAAVLRKKKYRGTMGGYAFKADTGEMDGWGTYFYEVRGGRFHYLGPAPAEDPGAVRR
jgi:ABC-type branched-subunit amino acid transport system substrate-binding protein